MFKTLSIKHIVQLTLGSMEVVERRLADLVERRQVQVDLVLREQLDLLAEEAALGSQPIFTTNRENHHGKISPFVDLAKFISIFYFISIEFNTYDISW